MRLTPIFISSLLSVFLAARHIPAAETYASVAPMDCAPIDVASIDSSLTALVIDSSSEYDNSFCHTLAWSPAPESEVEKYYVEVSLLPNFAMLSTCQLVDVPITSAVICVPVEDTVWYRVRSTYNDPEEGIMFGPSSYPVFVVQDTSAPVILGLQIQDKQHRAEGYVEAESVEIAITGQDNFPGACAAVRIWEAKNGYAGIQRATDDCEATIPLALSPERERKTVCAVLYDLAGNVSDTACAATVLEPRAHSYPNPFSLAGDHLTVIAFGLRSARSVSFRIYDLFGNLVYHRDNIVCHSGLNEIEWHGCNDQGVAVSEGGYLCMVDCGDSAPLDVKIMVVK